MRHFMRSNWIFIAALPLMLLIAVVANGEISSVKVQSLTYPTAAPGVFSVGPIGADVSITYALDAWENFSVQIKCSSTDDDVDYDLDFKTALENDRGKMVELSATPIVANRTAETWTTPISLAPPVASHGFFSITGNANTTDDTKCVLIFGRER
jgi:hypothetical protein